MSYTSTPSEKHVQLLTLDEETEFKINFTLLCRNSTLFCLCARVYPPSQQRDVLLVLTAAPAFACISLLIMLLFWLQKWRALNAELKTAVCAGKQYWSNYLVVRSCGSTYCLRVKSGCQLLFGVLGTQFIGHN